MLVKKLILFIILFSGILGCQCFNGETEWNIYNFNVSIYDKKYRAPVNGLIRGDSVKLQLMFEPDIIENHSCDYPGEDGMKDGVAEFIITSNSMFNAIPMGEPLNKLLIVNGEVSIDDWISTSDMWTFRENKSVKLMFTEEPQVSSTHIFTLKFVMESGITIEQSTEEIQWN